MSPPTLPRSLRENAPSFARALTSTIRPLIKASEKRLERIWQGRATAWTDIHRVVGVATAIHSVEIRAMRNTTSVTCAGLAEDSIMQVFTPYVQVGAWEQDSEMPLYSAKASLPTSLSPFPFSSFPFPSHALFAFIPLFSSFLEYALEMPIFPTQLNISTKSSFVGGWKKKFVLIAQFYV